MLFSNNVAPDRSKARDPWTAAFALELCAIALLYYALARGGLALATANPNATLIWPPTGLALAVTLLRGYRVAPAIFAGAFAANFATTGSFAVSAAIGLGNMLEALVAAWMIGRLSGGQDIFANATSIARFSAVACLVPTLGAAIGVTSLALGDFVIWPEFDWVWLTWWLGDAAGALIVTPVIMLWIRDGQAALQRKELIRSLALYAGTSAIGVIAFTNLLGQSGKLAPLGFLVLLPLLWAALQHSQRDTMTTALIVTAFAAFGAYTGTSLFGRIDPHETILLQILFVISIVVPSLMLSADTATRKLANQELETRVAQRTAQLTQEIHLREQSEERRKLVEAAVNDGVWDKDLLTGELYLSPRWKAILRYADDELPNTEAAYHGLIHPDDLAAIAEARRKYDEEGIPLAVDQRLRCKDGSYRWVQGRGSIIRDAANRPVRLLGTITDITARKNAEEALARANQALEARVAERTAELEQSQERYRLIEAAVNDGVWDWNILTDAHYRSPRADAILGFSGDELPQFRSALIERLLHPDDKAAFAAAVRAHLDENKPYAIDYRLRCKDGIYRWVHSRGQVVRDAEGRPVRMLGTIADITTRKQAEVELKESHDNLARAETMALLGHFKYELESDTLTWSQGHFRLMGKSPETFSPTRASVVDLIHPDDRPIMEQYRRDLMADRNPVPATMRWIKDDGEVIICASWTTLMFGSGGTIIGYFGTVQDVTARKRAEMALERANLELERRVAERTAELAQELTRREDAQAQLVQAQKMDAIGQLTAGIAHDFNNLLAVIQGSLKFVAEAAERGLTAEPELIDAALRASGRGASLVQRLLAFSRQQPLKAEPTAVDQMVLDTLRLLQRTLGEHVSIDTQLHSANSLVLVDRNQLANALLNLALNARDAMPEGGQLRIATARRPAPWAAAEGAAHWPTGEAISIVVSDTGTGMTDRVRDRAFEPFFTTKRDGLGTGLGLSMVHGFVQQSGGRIEIESAPGQGTTITIHLPRIDVPGQTAEVSADIGSSTSRQEKIVLLVEDDLDVRVVTAAQLRQLGYRVHAVANGNEAIDLIASPANVDILLTDIILPDGIDGVTLVKEAMRARPSLGVLCMSGYDPSRDRRKWLQIQNIGFLQKPFSIAKLAQSLEATYASEDAGPSGHSADYPD